MGFQGVGPLNPAQFGGAKGQAHFDAFQRLDALGNCPAGNCLLLGTMHVAEPGFDDYVAWGRWKAGTADLRSGEGVAKIELSYWQGLHYLIGVPTVTMPTQGEFGYTLMGATRPTLSDGSVAPGTFEAAATVRFAPGRDTRIALDGKITFEGTVYTFATPGGLSKVDSGGLRMSGTTTFAGTLAVDQSGTALMSCDERCRMTLNGGFFGPAAARMGVEYSVSGDKGGRTIDGVGVFTKR
jgi:hypothetical protein